MKAPALPSVPHKRYIYLQGATASMGSGIGSTPSQVTRHDVVLRLTVHGEPFEIEAGALRGPVSAVVLPPSQPHSANCQDAAFITYVVHVIHPRFRAVRAALAGKARVLDHARFAHLVPRMDDACFGRLSVDECCDLMESLLEVLLEGAAPVPPLDLRIPWVMRKLDIDIDHPFEQLAAELKLSPSRLSHLFSKELGLSFRSYQSWARLRLAWEMFANKPAMSVAEIAQALGYADAAQLTRSFHNTLGFPPLALRDPRIIESIGQGMPPGQHIPSDHEMRKS